MAKKVQSYNLMVAHSSDTSEFVDAVKADVAKFCIEYNKYNVKSVVFEVQDFNDATFAQFSKKDTQDVVFEQFAGRTDIVIALVGNRMGPGLRTELESFLRENKQTFVYLYDGGFRIYSRWNEEPNFKETILNDVDETMKLVREFYNKGYAKIFVSKGELAMHIIEDLGRFIQHRQRIKYELLDKSYSRFAYDEVDRYRSEIPAIEEAFCNEYFSSHKNENEIIIRWMQEHSKTNILELMRLLRSMLADEFDLDYSDITVSFVWGYHNPSNKEERLIRINSQNVISLNHSGTPAKLEDLLKNKSSLLRYMIVSGMVFKWYQYKSFACSKGRYWWPNYENSEKNKCMAMYGDNNNKRATSENCCRNCSNQCGTEKKEEKASEHQFGGSIFCYRIVLNGDAAKTNNYASGYIMVSTYFKPFTNTEHPDIRNEVRDSIKNMVDYRIKPQLLVELAQLYTAYLYSGNKEIPDEYEETWEEIEKDCECFRSLERETEDKSSI